MQPDQNQPEFPKTFVFLHHLAETVMAEEFLSLCMQIFENVQGALNVTRSWFSSFAALNSFVSGAGITSMLLSMHTSSQSYEITMAFSSFFLLVLFAVSDENVWTQERRKKVPGDKNTLLSAPW